MAARARVVSTDDTEVGRKYTIGGELERPEPFERVDDRSKLW